MDNHRKKTIGPYVLDSMLGKGQTGIVRLGIHCTTKEKVAVKIIDRTKLSPQILSKVEREIAIMKLIEHPHVLRLYDVYENRTHLFLILEYVGGGELFDYLVKKGRLSIKEARRFFSQIISAVDFCHKHCVCHRDLKPENLLLDEKQNIKVADFGMASLQFPRYSDYEVEAALLGRMGTRHVLASPKVGDNYMLETSCGSPHYACPEVVKGIKYDGRKADIWSCGVILYALVVGVLPFDDDNLRHLLEKVKKGTFRIPENVQTDCQHLIKEMIKVDPNRRISMKQILNHHFLKNHVEILEQLPVQKVVKTEVISAAENIDPDVLTCMCSLGCFHDKEKLVEELLREEENMEKVMYFLLLERKERRPCCADVVPNALRQMTANHFEDPPRKRVDSCGSPRLNRSSDSDNGDSVYLTRPRAATDISALKGVPAHKASAGRFKSSTPPGSPWWAKIPGMKKPSPRGSPILPRKKMHSSNPTLDTSPKQKGNIKLLETYIMDEKWIGNFGELSKTGNKDWTTFLCEVKRSWFGHLPLGHSHCNYKEELRVASRLLLLGDYVSIRKYNELSHYGRAQISINSDKNIEQWLLLGFQTIPRLTMIIRMIDDSHCNYKEEPFFVVVKDKPLTTVKADIVHAFLSIPHLTHNVTSPTTFTAEHVKHKGSSVFRKIVRMDVNIVDSTSNGQDHLHNFTVNMRLITGSSSKFKKLCEQVQEVLLSNRRCSSPEKPRYSLEVDGKIPTGDCSQEEQKPDDLKQKTSVSDQYLSKGVSEEKLLSSRNDQQRNSYSS